MVVIPVRGDTYRYEEVYQIDKKFHKSYQLRYYTKT